MKWIVRVLVLAFILTPSGCAGDCTAILIHGIVVTIVDDATGNRFEEDVTVIATEGSYTETVSPPVHPGEPRTASLAGERPGTYRIEVQAPGYVTWVMPSVRVTKDDCHVETVQLTARLEKAGAG